MPHLNERSEGMDRAQFNDRSEGMDRAVLVERAIALLRPLLNYARHELRTYEALGDLWPGAVRAEEVVDDALVEAVRHAGEAPAERLYPWLRRFVRRVISRQVAAARRRRRERSLDEPVGTQWPSDEGSRPRRLIDVLPDPASPIPAQVVESAEFQRALIAVLLQLPESWREPFFLHVFEGLPLEEVARLEGLPIDEVRRRIDWVRDFLRAVLAEEYDDLSQPPSEKLFEHLARTEPAAQHVAQLRSRLDLVAS
jgi:RNA polymerase sigma factor (sigma-70 family)